MPVNEHEVDAVKNLLWPNEVVEGTVEQRRIGPGGSLIAPTLVIATNMRIIIVNKASLGMRKDYEIIPYKQITSVRLEHGIISSTIFLRVDGYDTDKGLLSNGKQEGEMDGLKNREAVELADLINKKITQNIEPAEGQLDSKIGAYVYCTNCGAKDKADAKFCGRCGTKL